MLKFCFDFRKVMWLMWCQRMQVGCGKECCITELETLNSSMLSCWVIRCANVYTSVQVGSTVADTVGPVLEAGPILWRSCFRGWTWRSVSYNFSYCLHVYISALASLGCWGNKTKFQQCCLKNNTSRIMCEMVLWSFLALIMRFKPNRK
jgi:hypothetical protein